MYEFDEARLAKIESLRELGAEPYPHGFTTQHTAEQTLALIGDRSNEQLAEDTTEVSLAGRLLAKNEMGKAGFARIQDRTGRIQLFVRKNDLGDEAFALWKKLDLGDHVHATGHLMRTRTGEATVRVQTLRLAAKCMASLPDKWKGVSDVEFKSRRRYVDLFMDAQSRETFHKRSRIVRYIRDFFETRDFLEVETPMMQNIPGGATARPFVTHHNALGIPLYLRVAPELFLKRLVVGGFERVFEINRNFRNEGVSTLHNPEFTMLEFYWAYATWHDLMDLTEELVSGLAEQSCGSSTVSYGELELDFGRPWRRLSFSQAIRDVTGLQGDEVHDPEALRTWWLARHSDESGKALPNTMGRWFERIFDAHVEQTLVQPTFLTHFPAEISPLSRACDDDVRFVDRFELFVAGRELANGFNELNDPVDQARRFEAQVTAREEGDDEAMYFDNDYVRALTYGMPPTAGEGIGIDRLVMLLTNRASIREVILFPTLRPEGSAGSAPPDEGRDG